jgi:hypothetical protein
MAEVLAAAAIAGTLGSVTDRRLRLGLRRIVEQAERGELTRNDDVAIAARRAQMLALRLSLRGYRRLLRRASAESESHITRPLSELVSEALSPRKREIDPSTQRIVTERMEPLAVAPESPDGSAEVRQGEVRRLVEDWTLAEARARVRNAADWAQFERQIRKGDGRRDAGAAIPPWWDAFRIFLAEEFRCDMRLAAILAQRGVVEIVGADNDLKTVLADMGKGRDAWFQTIAPALPALRTEREKLKRNLERFDRLGDEIAETGDLIQTAGEANDLAARHREAGRREEALPAAKQAVACYRRLVASNRSVFLADLAASLSSLAGLVSDADAPAAAKEAVELYRELLTRDGGAVLPDLAKSLGDLAERLTTVGQGKAALAANAEAVGFYRSIAAKEGSAFLPDLARLSRALAARLTQAGQDKEALAVNIEAAGLYRELVARDRTLFLPELAGSLNDLAGALGRADRGEEALAAATDVVRAYRELAAGNDDRYEDRRGG